MVMANLVGNCFFGLNSDLNWISLYLGLVRGKDESKIKDFRVDRIFEFVDKVNDALGKEWESYERNDKKSIALEESYQSFLESRFNFRNFSEDGNLSVEFLPGNVVKNIQKVHDYFNSKFETERGITNDLVTRHVRNLQNLLHGDGGVIDMDLDETYVLFSDLSGVVGSAGEIYGHQPH